MIFVTYARVSTRCVQSSCEWPAPCAAGITRTREGIMNAFRATLVAASLVTLSAASLSAQSTRISCKDGSKPKIGHFSCWGHGGLVRQADESVKPALKSTKAPKPKKATTATKKASAKKAHVPAATPHKKKSAKTSTATHASR